MANNDEGFTPQQIATVGAVRRICGGGGSGGGGLRLDVGGGGRWRCAVIALAIVVGVLASGGYVGCVVCVVAPLRHLSGCIFIAGVRCTTRLPRPGCTCTCLHLEHPQKC